MGPLTRRRPHLFPYTWDLLAPHKELLFRANHSVDLAMKFPEGAITFGGRLRGLALHALGRLLEIGLRIQSSSLHIFGDALCPDRLTGSSLDRSAKLKATARLATIAAVRIVSYLMPYLTPIQLISTYVRVNAVRHQSR